MFKKLLFFGAGVGAGVLTYRYFTNKKTQKKVDDAWEKAWVAAHQSVEKLLDWGHENGKTPGEIKAIMRDEA